MGEIIVCVGSRVELLPGTSLYKSSNSVKDKPSPWMVTGFSDREVSATLAEGEHLVEVVEISNALRVGNVVFIRVKSVSAPQKLGWVRYTLPPPPPGMKIVRQVSYELEQIEQQSARNTRFKVRA